MYKRILVATDGSELALHAAEHAIALAKSLGVPLDRAGRVQVTPELTVPGHPEIFVIGDLATLQQDGKPLPGVAPVAMQAGRHTAVNLRRAARGDRTAARQNPAGFRFHFPIHT